MFFGKNVRPLTTVAGLGMLPQSLASGANTPTWGKAETGRSILLVAMAGAIAGGGSAVIKLQQASDSSGTGAADITGYTSIITYADTEDGAVKVYEIPASLVQSVSAGAKPYFGVVCTTASATVLMSVAALELDPRITP